MLSPETLLDRSLVNYTPKYLFGGIRFPEEAETFFLFFCVKGEV